MKTKSWLVVEMKQLCSTFCRSKWTDLEKRTRAAIKEVIPCDVLQPDPLLSYKYEPYDCVLSSLCLDAAAKTIQVKPFSHISQTHDGAYN